MEKQNLNLAKVARSMTPKLGHEEPEYTMGMSHRVRPAMNWDNQDVCVTFRNEDTGRVETVPMPIVERVVVSRRQPGKPAHAGEDLAATLAQLEAMPKLQQRWLSIASYFAAKAPKSDQQDWQQEIYLRLVESDIRDTNAAFTYASRMHLTLWRNYRRHSFFCEPMSASVTNVLDADDPYAAQTVEDIASDVPWLDDAYEYIDNRIDATLLWGALNATPRLRAILDKRLRGAVIAAKDRMYLMRFLNSHRDIAIAHS